MVLQEAQASAELMTQIIDDKFSTIELVATNIGASSWSPYLASQSEILNSRVDYFKEKEILKELGVFKNSGIIVGSLSSDRDSRLW